jgi:hypothetical protein
VALLLGVCFLASHLLLLAPTPASIDAVNFVLGVRDFDPSDHRPHPPGYPVYVALGKVSRWAWAQFELSPGDPLKAATRSLSFWAAFFGAIAAWPLLQIFRRLGASERTAVAAVVLTIVSPLFWMTSLRPLSDVPGLVAALIAQALLLTAVSVPSGLEVLRGGSMRAATLGALACGLAIGMRSQNVWLTGPLMALVMVRSPGRGWALSMRMLTALGAGVAAWAIPLLIATGGAGVYARAFLGQALDDWTGARILATSATWGQFVDALSRTFLFPWGTNALAALVLLFAVAALAFKAMRSRRPLALLLTMYGPYLVFHLAFQEADNTRYALPLVPPVAFLAARGMEVMAPRLMPLVAAGAAVASLLTVLPSSLVYAEHGHPAFRVVPDIAARMETLAIDRPRPLLSLHYSASRLLRGQNWPLGTLPAPPGREWLAKVSYWRSGGDAPIWLIADTVRTDAALFDPASRRLLNRYPWPFRPSVLTGAQPKNVHWYEISPPGWMTDEGWALTPEIGGLTFRDRTGPEHGPIHAYIRRRNEGATVLVGGRFVGGAGAPPARIRVELDGRLIDSWQVAPGSFLRSWRIAPGALAGADAYATLRVKATLTGRETGRVEIDQFDAQSEGTPVYGLDRGWYEMELDPKSGETWRWTGAEAEVRVEAARGPLRLRLRGERPRGARVVVRAGAHVAAVAAADGDTVDLSAAIPPDALARAANVVTLQVSAGGSRRAGLRVTELTLRPGP